MENQTKPFNKFAKWTIYSLIGSIFLLLISFWSTNMLSAENIINLPLPWENESLMSILLSGIWNFPMFLYICSAILFVLSFVFSIVASIQTHKRNERGGVISLLIVGIFIIAFITILLF